MSFASIFRISRVARCRRTPRYRQAIPSSFRASDSVFVSGQVTTAGEYPIRKGMTVRQVLALAGGVTDRGSTGRIQIIRQIDGQDRTISASFRTWCSRTTRSLSANGSSEVC